MYKITCEPVKNMLGKKTGEFKATFGSFEEIGANKEDACKKLNDALDWFFEESFCHIKIRHTTQRTYILTRNFWGYLIRISNKDGSYDFGGYGFGRVSEYQAEKELENYVKSCTECSDDTYL